MLVGLKAAQKRPCVSFQRSRRESFSVRRHEILHGHWRFTGQFGDDLVFAREDAALIVEGDRAQNAGS